MKATSGCLYPRPCREKITRDGSAPKGEGSACGRDGSRQYSAKVEDRMKEVYTTMLTM